MPLSPIEIFRPQQSIVGRMLEGGTRVFGDALNGVMNIGRDMVNNQHRQERDFITERNNQDAIAVRRGDRIRSMFEADRTFDATQARDARDFGRRVVEDERDFDFRQDQAERTDTYRDADLKIREENQEIAKKGQEITEKNYGLAEEDNKLARDKFDFEKSDKEAQTKFNRDLLPEFGPTSQTPTTPGEDYAAAQIEMDAAKAARDAPAYKAAAAKAARAKAAGTVTDDNTISKERLEIAQRNEERTIAKDEAAARDKAAKDQEELAKQLVDDKTAFSPQTQFVTPDDIKNGTPAARAADAWDKDRFASERAAATSVSKEEFINKGENKTIKLSEKQKAKRGKFWDLVNQKAPATTAAAPSGKPSSETDWVNENLK